MKTRPLLVSAALIALPAFAQNSQPQPIPAVSAVPASRDTPYPGTIQLDVDATDVTRAIFKVKESIPVADAGPMTLLFPKWLQGAHAPRGEIEKLSGLIVTSGGKRLTWKRDPYDVHAFHIDVPRGARTVELAFQFISATDGNQGRIVMTPAILNLQWNSVALYPAGYFARQIPIQATARYPEGWRAFSGLPSSASGSTYRYEKTNFEVLVDSPVFAGRYTRQEQLTPDVRLNIVADEAADLVATPDQIAAHRRLVEQAVKLFGAQHYDKYEFLFSLSDKLGSIGLEHQRSSENGVDSDYFTKWNDGPGRRNLLPHEFTHSWNGKFRRPAGLWTPDHNTPTKNSLLWVYEGQTQFWGYVLGARSGLFTKQETLDAMASIAATLDQRPAREWRGLEDTTYDPIISARRPKGWVSWQRSEDYYNEGMLVWLEVDATLRRLTKNQKGMDDFARAFFGIRDRDWGTVTYTIEDIAKTLNDLAPHDWAGLLERRLFENAKGAPLTGFTASGYTLAFTPEQTPFMKDGEKRSKGVDLSFSGGFSVDKDKKVSGVIWDGPAYKAGLTVGSEVVAVSDKPYSIEVLKEAVTAAATAKEPIRLLVKKFDGFREVPLDWHGGLRYPRFQKTGTGEGALDRLLAPR
jgi:predicted metalloprotease with PDZ domain